jgi:hypothetical protein
MEHGGSPVSVLTGWVKQGTENLFATQRILLDLVMRQNSMTINAVRDALSFKRPKPEMTLTELVCEGYSNFIAAQRILLNLTQRETELAVTGIRQRVGSNAFTAMTDLLGRSVDTFVDMQQHMLTLVGNENEAWLDAAKTGEPYAGKGLTAVAKEAVDIFVKSQKKFMDAVAEQVSKATEGKGEEAEEETERIELAELAKQASDTFIDAQKKLLDVAGKQVDVNLNAVEWTAQMIPPPPKFDFAHFTRETVDSYVTAQKALMDIVNRPAKRHHEAEAEEAPERATRRKVRAAKGRKAEAEAETE